MGSCKARVYYNLEGMPHTWVRLSGLDGATETKGFAPAEASRYSRNLEMIRICSMIFQ